MFFCYYADHSDSSGVGEAGSGEAHNPWRNHDAQARWFELSHNWIVSSFCFTSTFLDFLADNMHLLLLGKVLLYRY